MRPVGQELDTAPTLTNKRVALRPPSLFCFDCPMKTYESFARHLETVLDGDKAIELVVEGWMPLSIERIDTTVEGHSLIAMAHYLSNHAQRQLERNPEITPLARGSRCRKEQAQLRMPLDIPPAWQMFQRFP